MGFSIMGKVDKNQACICRLWIGMLLSHTKTYLVTFPIYERLLLRICFDFEQTFLFITLKKIPQYCQYAQNLVYLLSY